MENDTPEEKEGSERIVAPTSDAPNPIDPKKSNRNGYIILAVFGSVAALTIAVSVVGAFAVSLAGSTTAKSYLAWTSASVGFYDENDALMATDDGDLQGSFSAISKEDSSGDAYYSISGIDCPADAVTLVMPSYANSISVQSVESASDENPNIFANSDCSSLQAIYFPVFYFDIGTSAFADCASLKTVSFSSSSTKVQSLGERAFANDVSLENVAFPDSLNSVGASCFYGDASLETISLPSSLREIKDEAFYGSALTDITYLGTMAEWGKVTIGENAFPGSASKISCVDGDIEL